MRPGDTWTTTFALSGTPTGTPTVQLLHNGVNDSAVSPVVSTAPGVNSYKVVATIPASGYAASDTVEYNATATISANTPSTQSAIVARSHINAPVLVGTNGITYASFDATTKSDGTAQAGSTTTTLNFDAADGIANGLAVGALSVPRDVMIVSGTGIGQVRSVASLAGSSGSRIGTVTVAWVTTPDNTSAYAWRGATAASSGGSAPTVAQIRSEMDANSTKLAYLTGPAALAAQIPAHFTNATFSADGVFATAALVNAPTGSGGGGTLTLATGTVTGSPTGTSISLTNSTTLKAVAGFYTGRRLYGVSGAVATEQTDPCATHAVTGSGTSAVHTFTFVAAQQVATAGDVMAVAGA